MSGGGADDRPGAGALLVLGDRPVPAPVKLRCLNATLLDLAGRRIALVAMVVDHSCPEIVMFEGEPFLREPFSHPAPHYRQVRPYRADAMVIELPAELAK